MGRVTLAPFGRLGAHAGLFHRTELPADDTATGDRLIAEAAVVKRPFFIPMGQLAIAGLLRPAAVNQLLQAGLGVAG